MTDARWAAPVDMWATDPRTWPPVITRVYRGTAESVVEQMQWEANRFTQVGYTVTSQVHVPGQWGCGIFAAAALLILLFGLGLLILGYLLIVKPDGTLTVVYTRR